MKRQIFLREIGLRLASNIIMLISFVCDYMSVMQGFIVVSSWVMLTSVSSVTLDV